MLTRFRQKARRAWADFGRNVLAKAALRNHVRPSTVIGDPAVHMLVSSKTWDAGVLAAASFEHHTGRRWKFFIHDDGTLDESARRGIREVFDDAVIIGRAEADKRAAELLAGHPKCLDRRSRHNLFLKFSDFVAWTPGRRFIVLDSDVIFFRRPAEIVAWAESGADTCHYNEDTKEKFCIPRPFIQERLGVDMWPRFNSGLVLMPAEAVSLDAAERLVEAFEENAHHPQFFEQTLYGLMGSIWGRGGHLPATYEISWGYLRHRGAVCRHYVGDFKHDLLYVEGATVFWWRSCILGKLARSR